MPVLRNPDFDFQGIRMKRLRIFYAVSAVALAALCFFCARQQLAAAESKPDCQTSGAP